MHICAAEFRNDIVENTSKKKKKNLIMEERKCPSGCGGSSSRGGGFRPTPAASLASHNQIKNSICTQSMISIFKWSQSLRLLLWKLHSIQDSPLNRIATQRRGSSFRLRSQGLQRSSFLPTRPTQLAPKSTLSGKLTYQ